MDRLIENWFYACCEFQVARDKFVTCDESEFDYWLWKTLLFSGEVNDIEDAMMREAAKK